MTKEAKDDVDMSHHFEDLAKHYNNEDFDKALRSVNLILKELPSDPKALHSKSVCLIQLCKFPEALEVLSKLEDQSVVLLPTCYALYRLNRYSEILERLEQKNPQELSLELKELKAQTLYKLEQYDECLELYKELLKKQRDDLDSERQSNFLAVLTQLAKSGATNLPSFTPSAMETYELFYNAAALDMAKGNYGEAEKKLRKAETLFRSFAKEEELSTVKIRAELSTLKTQLLSVLLQKARKQPLEKAAPGFNVEAIEGNFLNQFAKMKKKGKKEVGTAGDMASPKVKAGGKVEPIKKKKRKRKPRLPKNFDPKVKPDPERWLPKHERSTFKKKKDKRGNVGKGTQGSTAVQEPVNAGPSTPKTQHTAATNQPQGPRQQRPPAAAKKQTKKKRK